MTRKTTEKIAPLALAALGVVFGDIGTSPLYAFQQCFGGEFGAVPTPENIVGICSLIFWALVIVVSVKYVTFMLRADYDGEGGILALLAQLVRREKRGAFPAPLSALALIVLIGAAALYGDGIITPSISVISAIEGLDVWTKVAHPFIVPLSVIVLIGLFALQSRGTGGIGRLFGPIMVLWFLTIGTAGVIPIAHHPQILVALNPVHSWLFLLRHGFHSVLIFGAVVLCVTGVEALYADLAHFGRRPITWAWYCLVFPALILNYFGQGANALSSVKTLENSFFLLYPSWMVVPMVILATVATVIASQALIAGAFSLTQQATQLGYAPRFSIVHTSRHYIGQIYMPAINVMLAVGACILVITFRSSAALSSAYGLAVTITMLATTIAYAHLTRAKYRWKPWIVLPLIALFLSWDVPFFLGNAIKFASGGWLPLAIASLLFTLFTTWNRGRRRMMQGLAGQTMPLEQFLQEAHETSTISGTAVFLTPDPEGIPFAMRHQWLREHIMFDTVILLTIVNEARPYIHPSRRVEVSSLAKHLYRVRAHYGFMQQPKIEDILAAIRLHSPEIHTDNATYYLASPKIGMAKGDGRLPDWQRSLYRWMIRNARPLTDSLELPPNRIVEFGVEVPI